MNNSNDLQIKYCKNLNLNKFECFCFLLIIILVGWAPAHESSTLGSEQLVLLCKLFRWGMVLFISFIEIWKAFVYGLHIKWLALIPIPYYVMIFFNSYDNEMFPIIGLLTAMLFLNLSDQSKVWIYRQYRRWIIFMSLMGIICYLSYVFKLGIPYKEVIYYGIHSISNWYFDFKITYLYVPNNDAVRLCGLFNEPGYLGTIIGLILVAEGLNLKRIGNVIMFIAGCCTFSLAFVVLLIMAFVLQNVQRIKIFLPIAILVVGLCNFFPNIQFDNYQMQNLFNRLRIEDGRWVGYNRETELYNQQFWDVLSSDKIFWGNGYDYHTTVEYGGGVASFKEIIIDNGILGFLICFGIPFLCVLLLYVKNGGLLYIICFFASLVQRPYLYSVVYFSLLFSALEYIKSKFQNDKFKGEKQ